MFAVAGLAGVHRTEDPGAAAAGAGRVRPAGGGGDPGHGGRHGVQHGVRGVQPRPRARAETAGTTAGNEPLQRLKFYDHVNLPVPYVL